MKRRNPDDFTLLHRIRFKVRQYKVGFSIEVYDGPQQIARGKFFKGPWTAGPWEKERVVEAVIIEVEKPWQRKGVASAIYRKVEELGYTIHPSSSQTHFGIKLWRGGRWGKRDEVVNSGILSRWKTEYARTNPDDKDRLAKMKFAARLFRESRGGKACDVTAKLGGAIIGRAVFHGYSSGGENSISEASGIWVHPEHRRIGVASRMVTLAEETMGARWSGRAISEDGEGFIAGRRKNPGDEAELVRLAFAEYGVTRDFRECGYIMTDGRMLDFSEKRDGGNPGTRSLDHRAVYGVVKKAGFAVENRGYGSESNSVKAFLEACGAVRVMFMEGGGSYRGKPVGNIFYLHVARRPTAAQLLTIAGAIRNYTPEMVQVAFGESVEMVEIEPVTAGRVRQVLESLS